MSPMTTTLNIQQSKSKQWGTSQLEKGKYLSAASFPISFTKTPFAVIAYDVAYDYDGIRKGLGCTFEWVPDGSSDNGKGTRWARIVSNSLDSYVGEYRFIAIGM